MNISPQPVLKVDILKLIGDALDAELCRDLKAWQYIFDPIWPDIDQAPNFDGYEPMIRAQLLRLAGVFLSFYGKSKNVQSCHSRAKNHLTTASEMFEEMNAADRASEARVMLAFAFWNCGEVDECDAILQMVEHQFKGSQLHPVYLQLKVNQMMALMWRNSPESLQKAGVIVDELSIPMEFCQDARILALFNCNSGIYFRLTGQLDKAIFRLQEAARIAGNAGNRRFVAISLNNLAMTSMHYSRLNDAFRYADDAISVITEVDDEGWLAHILDTKAQLLLADHRPDEALQFIDDSISLFEKGDDFGGLCESLWTRCVCLFRTGREQEALKQYYELRIVSAEKIGPVAVEKFEKCFLSEIYVKRGLPYFDESDKFMRTLIVDALRTSGLDFETAARKLQIPTENELISTIDNYFADIYEELGIEHRPRLKRVSEPVQVGNQSKVRTITRYQPPKDCTISFSDEILSIGEFEVFFCSANLMRSIGIDHDCVIAVAVPDEWLPGMPVVYNHNDSFWTGKIEVDKLTGVLHIPSLQEFPVMLEDVAFVGIPIGYADFANVDSGHIEFLPLNFTC